MPLPVDVACGKELTATARAEVKETADVAGDDLILDIGPAAQASGNTSRIFHRRRAFLELLEGNKLPAVEILEHRASTVTV